MEMRRRTLLAAGSAGIGLLAGCASGRDRERADAEADDDSHSVTMAPAGTVEFDAVPRNVMAYDLLYVDALVAYGHGDAVNSIGFDVDAGGRTLNAYYDHLDGVSFDWDGLEQLNTASGGLAIDKELFYDLDSDLHLLDPCFVRSLDDWDRSDVEEIRSNVGPWLGNAYSRDHGRPPEGCDEDYRYYTLWEIAEKIAAAFRERTRYEELRAVRDEMVGAIRSNLPPADERPTVGSVIFMDGSFYPTTVNSPGFANAHVRPLEAVDAFEADDVAAGTAYSYEAMLEFDPDILLHEFGIASYYDVGGVVETLADHPVGSRLTAVETGRVYPSANPVQGPVMNLFQLEMTAKQLYPERFGAWPDDADGDVYPTFPESERLFDRQRVADIIAGTE